jgi:hypothetical protein
MKPVPINRFKNGTGSDKPVPKKTGLPAIPEKLKNRFTAGTAKYILASFAS